MQTITEFALKQAARGYFTREQASTWTGKSGASLDGLLKRAVASKETTRVTRGLYCLDNSLTGQKIDPLELAQLVYGPSYLSLEFALSYHGWIPEAVYSITSVSAKRSRVFDTPIGYFTYTRVPQRLFFAGVERIETTAGGSFLLANPIKALADLVYVRKVDDKPPLVFQSLRIDPSVLDDFSAESFEETCSAYRPGRVRRFLDSLREGSLI